MLQQVWRSIQWLMVSAANAMFSRVIIDAIRETTTIGNPRRSGDLLLRPAAPVAM
jgi:hypothetical protein